MLPIVPWAWEYSLSEWWSCPPIELSHRWQSTSTYGNNILEWFPFLGSLSSSGGVCWRSESHAAHWAHNLECRWNRHDPFWPHGFSSKKKQFKVVVGAFCIVPPPGLSKAPPPGFMRPFSGAQTGGGGQVIIGILVYQVSLIPMKCSDSDQDLPYPSNYSQHCLQEQLVWLQTLPWSPMRYKSALVSFKMDHVGKIHHSHGEHPASRHDVLQCCIANRVSGGKRWRWLCFSVKYIPWTMWGVCALLFFLKTL